MPPLGQSRASNRRSKKKIGDHTYLTQGGRRHRIVILPADKRENDLLGVVAIADECGFLVETARNRLKKGWPELGWEKVPSVRHNLPDPRTGRMRSMEFVRRRDLPEIVSRTEKGQTRFRFLHADRWVLTKDYVKRGRGMIGEAHWDELVFRSVRSPITGFDVDVCDEELVNQIRNERTDHAQDVERRMRIWAANLLRGLDDIRGDSKRTALATLIGWKERGCFHLDGEKLHMMLHNDRPRKKGKKRHGRRSRPRWSVDRSQADRILRSATAYSAGRVLDERQMISQNETFWAYKIGQYFLRVATKNGDLHPKPCGRRMLYSRLEIETLVEKLRNGPGTAQLTIREAAELRRIPYGRLKTAKWRGALKSERSSRRGTLNRKIRTTTLDEVDRYLDLPRKRGLPVFDGIYVVGPARRRTNITAAALETGIDRERIDRAVKNKKIPSRPQLRQGTQSYFERTVLIADVNRFFAEKSKRIGRPPDPYYEFMAAKLDAGTDVTSAIIEWNGLHPAARRALNAHAKKTTYQGVYRFRANKRLR